jgi:hypothetical protein
MNGWEEVLVRISLMQSFCTSVGVFAAGLLILLIARLTERRRR